MKILYNTYPIAFNTPGGGEVQLLKYAEHIKHYNIDIEFFDQWEPKLSTYDIAHFFSAMSGSVYFCDHIKKMGLPLIVSPNLWITEDTKDQYPHEEIRRIFVMADFIVVNSLVEGDLLAVTFEIPRQKFITVYNGIESFFLDKVDSSIFLNHYGIKGKFVLNIGNIEPRKNQLKLIKAMKFFPELKIVLIGHQRDPDYAKKCFQEAGEQLVYIGTIPNHSHLLRSAYAGCECMALPSIAETPGLVALEAGACGAKILITSAGSAREYFSDYATYVNPDSIDDIKYGIEKILRQGKSNELARLIGSKYLWSNVVLALHHLYVSIHNLYEIKKAGHGFYNLESAGENTIFMWSDIESEFDADVGILSFDWRANGEAMVDIFVGDKKIHNQVQVRAEWSKFEISILNNKSKIKFKVKNDPRERIDTRSLGFAICNVRYTADVKGEFI